MKDYTKEEKYWAPSYTLTNRKSLSLLIRIKLKFYGSRLYQLIAYRYYKWRLR